MRLACGYGLNEKGVTVSICLQVLNRHRLDWVRQWETEDARVKVKLAVERSLDVLRPPEAMLLALEGNVGDGQPFPAQGFDHHLRLVRRDDLAFEPLKEDHRAREPVREINRRPLPVEVAPLRV